MSEPRVFETLAEFKTIVGQEIGTSPWMTIDQDRINLFADATGDHQWIHVDPDAAAKGPFGTTIAHGYLTLSLLPVFSDQIYAVKDVVMGINYGTNKVRFPHPVPVNSRIRAKATLKETEEISIGTRYVVSFVIEIEGNDKPAAIAECVYVMATAAN